MLRPYLLRTLSKLVSLNRKFASEFIKPGKISDATVVLLGFENYAKIYSDHKIKRSFKVPSGDSKWPSATWGLPLGYILDAIQNRNSRKEIQSLVTKLGFNIKPRLPFESLKTALATYKSINGHVQVPSNYCISGDDNRYPDYLRGKHLGKAVNSAQKYGCYEEHHDELKEMGVNFELIGVRRIKFDWIYDACAAYNKIHGNLDVPYNFIVPCGLSIYPKHTWRLELGCALRMIRTKGLHSEHKDKLIPLGLNLKVKSPRTFETVYSALATYKSIHGNLYIPQKFVVPSDDIRYPREMWGMKLGKLLHNIRVENAFFEQRDKLSQLGVSFEVKAIQTHEFDDIFSALLGYKTVNGNLLVPQSFIIPHKDSNYPSETWGMNLGSVVSHIRIRGDYAQYKVKLQSIGLKYNDDKTQKRSKS